MGKEIEIFQSERSDYDYGNVILCLQASPPAPVPGSLQ